MVFWVLGAVLVSTPAGAGMDDSDLAILFRRSPRPAGQLQALRRIQKRKAVELVPQLFPLLEQPPIRAAVVESLVALGWAPVLGAELRSPDPEKRALAAHYLGFLASQPEAEELLAAALGDESEQVRSRAVFAWGARMKSLPEGEEADLEPIIERLEKDASEEVRAAAAKVLLNNDDPRAAAAIDRASSSDASAWVRLTIKKARQAPSPK